MNQFRFLILFTGMVVASLPLTATGLLANAASSEITPPPGMKFTLGGYGDHLNSPAEGVHDPIYAKALVLKKDTLKYAIVTLDILGLPSNLK